MLMLRLITGLLIVVVASSEAASSELLWESALPSEIRQRSFATPGDLRSHLDTLSDYYAVVGRPRFGKRNMKMLDLNFLKSHKTQIPRKYWNRIVWILSHPSMSQFLK